jgi:hypothetical protein
MTAMTTDAPQSTEDVAVPADRLDEFWRGIYPRGMTIENVCAELWDLKTLAGNVPLVYDHVTGGKASKANTDPSVIKMLHDEHVNELIEDALEDEREITADDVGGSGA